MCFWRAHRLKVAGGGVLVARDACHVTRDLLLLSLFTARVRGTATPSRAFYLFLNERVVARGSRCDRIAEFDL